ncbi:hypothetical protein LIER_24536 [Lithospermum erythrorhizon]|uniref:Uncharacterized protein n=1 Tax=Lithospermum erythrorhizon TaxID=34254 RepID=A0AAV3R1Q3_LITER
MVCSWTYLWVSSSSTSSKEYPCLGCPSLISRNIYPVYASFLTDMHGRLAMNASFITFQRWGPRCVCSSKKSALFGMPPFSSSMLKHEAEISSPSDRSLGVVFPTPSKTDLL